MKYQSTPYSCGAAAVVNALRCFGKKVPERIVQKVAFTDPDKGTDQHGIIASLRSLGYDGEVFEESSLDEAYSRLYLYIMEGKPVIICTQADQHWVTAIGYIGNDRRIVIADPARSERNKKENGVHVLTKNQLKKTWRSRGGKFFGIACDKK